jgi:hypothetical protein
VVLMTAFNFFSHGTQDLYPTFLQVQHGLSPHAVQGPSRQSTMSAPFLEASSAARSRSGSVGAA